MIDVSIAAQLLEQRRAAHAELFAAFPPAATIAAFDAIDERQPYHTLGPQVATQWSDIEARYGAAGFEAYQHVTLLTLMLDFESRARGHDYTPDILARFRHSFARIVAAIQLPDCVHYRSKNDILLKDMALCRQKMFPAGAQVVEPASSFHRALLFRGGLGQFFDVFKLLVGSGGHADWYQIHTHLEEREEFNPDGWDQCYLRLARMMERHPQIRGMYGGSWFYDPALARVSPRLTYLRTRPEENGALVCYSNDDPHGGALATSDTRRELYEKGQYLPKAYALIWPRAPLLAWARRFAGEHPL
jgi:hypothetical protein